MVDSSQLTSLLDALRDLVEECKESNKHAGVIAEFFAEELKHTREFHAHMNAKGVVAQESERRCSICTSTLHDDDYHDDDCHTVVQKAKEQSK